MFGQIIYEPKLHYYSICKDRSKNKIYVLDDDKINEINHFKNNKVKMLCFELDETITIKSKV